MTTELVAVTDRHLSSLMTWFDSEEALRSWAGPNFRYPYNQGSFKEDLSLGSLKSFSLVSEVSEVSAASATHHKLSGDEELLAFGQCYLRLGRCHLGRLVVSPRRRGERLIARLMQLLIEYGLQTFAVDEASLFVLEDNQTAINAYLRHGFVFNEYPEVMPISACHYMTLSDN